MSEARPLLRGPQPLLSQRVYCAPLYRNHRQSLVLGDYGLGTTSENLKISSKWQQDLTFDGRT